MYTLLELALMVCTQFYLKQKRQFSFRDVDGPFNNYLNQGKLLGEATSS